MAGVNSLQGIGGVGRTLPAPAADRQTGSTGFADVLKQSMAAVNDRSQAAEEAITGLVSGENANIHETMIAMEEASISLRLMTRAQNKLLDAYQEIMRLQL